MAQGTVNRRGPSSGPSPPVQPKIRAQPKDEELTFPPCATAPKEGLLKAVICHILTVFIHFYLSRKPRGGCLGLSRVTKGVLAIGAGAESTPSLTIPPLSQNQGEGEGGGGRLPNASPRNFPHE